MTTYVATFPHPETGLSVHATFEEARLTFEVDESTLVSIQERGRIDKYDRDQVEATEEAIRKLILAVPRRSHPLTTMSPIRGDAIGLRGLDLKYATEIAKVVAGKGWPNWEEIR